MIGKRGHCFKHGSGTRSWPGLTYLYKWVNVEEFAYRTQPNSTGSNKVLLSKGNTFSSLSFTISSRNDVPRKPLSIILLPCEHQEIDFSIYFN